MRWKTFEKGNALERVRLIVDFAEDLPSVLFENLCDYIASQKDELSYTQVDSFNMRWSEGDTTGVNKTERFEWRDRDGKMVISSLSLNKKAFLFETAEYSGWQVFQKELMDAVDPILKLAMNSVAVENISLEYWDKFATNTNLHSTSVEDLFVGHDKVFPSVAFKKSRPWRLEKIWYESFDGLEMMLAQRTYTDSFEVLDEDDEGVLVIGVYTRTQCALEEAASFNSTINKLHTRNKNAFRKLLNAKTRNTLGF